MKYTVKKEDDGKKLKEILLSDIGLSASFLRHLKFTENGIKVNGAHATVRYVVHCGDILELMTDDNRTGSGLEPTDIPLDIIYEDSELVVPSKPPYMPTHPSHNHHGDTLADALAFRYKDQPSGFVFRPINRLDRNTSGLTIIAKNRISAAKLAESMRNGLIKKQYLAILDGVLPSSDGTIDTYLRRTSKSIIVREVCDKNGGGDRAITHYKTLRKTDKHTLVLASPETGRTHQLRVHFAYLGCPIIGDDMYGNTSEFIGRHALHAVSLDFPHPTNGETVHLSSPIPEDIARAITQLFD